MADYEAWREDCGGRHGAEPVMADNATEAARIFRERHYKHEDPVYLEEISVALVGSQTVEVFEVYAHRVVEFSAVPKGKKGRA